MQVLSEVLKKLISVERKVLNEHPTKHPVLIGEMYEGLTKTVLERIDFTHPDIKVVSGVIKTKEGQSGQIDLMVVIGEGEPIPHTDKYTYPIEQVVAVFEVKKSLYGPQVGDALLHLNKVFQLSKGDYQRKQDEGTLEFSTAQPAKEYRNLFGESPPAYEHNATLPFHKRVIYHTLVREWMTPLRIAIGYNGFADEHQFRKGLGRILIKNQGKPGYGVPNLPNLMISDGYSIVKLNGLPYKGNWDDTNGWCWLASSNENPIVLIMELLFHRVEHLLNAKPDRGMDLNEELLAPLILAKPLQMKVGGGAWTFLLLDGKPDPNDRRQEWTPLAISSSEMALLKLLADNGPLYAKSSVLMEFFRRHRIADIQKFTDALRSARALLQNDGILSISPGCWAVTKVKTQLYCADNGGNRLYLWAKRHTPMSQPLNPIYTISPSLDGP
ncbi:hypothetical protein AAY86_16475 [Pseudomonas amygdali pv. tabaci str. ATCC 11528]|uniref:DUF6602 domain-containing protein n=1 Tax=Pseudomonas amygdali TaxID=47877 RepID=UPI0001BC966F|nr:DUF6602 domain-containing protein [Pseudomonas amygdali]KEZ70450.1 hypothetical protein C1E_0203485 [Pseudomonas amygdali pv. tabaci str. ATCC 11528]KKY51965.1 hypothetical protein AAY86_16475 [Pseudomonas amygdali pv. tabaci str. ATCC 11528]QED86410.1 hypothetical protein PSYTB_23515 [Pseudomonas amygdali pv. tabaci str. ATCC 11528]